MTAADEAAAGIHREPSTHRDVAVRQAAAIGFSGSAYAESFVLADVAMEWAPGADEVSLTFAAEGLTVVAPLPGGGISTS